MLECTAVGEELDCQPLVRRIDQTTMVVHARGHLARGKVWSVAYDLFVDCEGGVCVGFQGGHPVRCAASLHGEEVLRYDR